MKTLFNEAVWNAPDMPAGGAGDTAPAVAPAAEITAPAAPKIETLLGGDAPAPETKPAAGDPATDAEYKNDDAKTPEENAAAKEAFDKAKTDAKAKADEPVDPASYTIELRDGEALDPTIDKEFREYAAANKMSQDDVSKLTGFQRKVMEKQAENLAKNVETWGNELRDNKEIGGADFERNCGHARAARDAFFPPEMKDIFNKTGLGNYPAFVVGMVRIGKAMGEAGIVPGGGAKSSDSAVDILYGNSE